MREVRKNIFVRKFVPAAQSLQELEIYEGLI